MYGTAVAAPALRCAAAYRLVTGLTGICNLLRALVAEVGLEPTSSAYEADKATAPLPRII